MSTEGVQMGAELTTAAKLAESRALAFVDEGSRVCSMDASC